MKKALFLFFEGLPDTVIDSQVLIHCKEMKKIGVEFEIWSFACNNELYLKSINKINYAKELSQCEVKVFRGVRPAYPFSENINALLVKRNITKYKKVFDIVHARTDYSSHIASLITNRFIWDCRGDTLAEFEKAYEKSNNILGKLYKKYKIINNIEYARKGRKAIFVSTFLKDKLEYKNESSVIGCTADSELFYFDNALRAKKRKELGYSISDKVLIYSGGMAYYQMFHESVKLFQELDDEWKLLVLTNDVKNAKKELNLLNEEKYILLNVPFDKVNEYLNLADIGIMLREENDLNKAASPTKYAEYSMSGLQIIHSSQIGDLYLYDKLLSNRIKFQDISKYKFNSDIRSSIAGKAKKYLDKKNNFQQYKRIYDV